MKRIIAAKRTYCNFCKGQLILKANCQALNFSKKRANKFVLTTMPHILVCFLEEIEDTKKSFEIT